MMSMIDKSIGVYLGERLLLDSLASSDYDTFTTIRIYGFRTSKSCFGCTNYLTFHILVWDETRLDYGDTRTT